MNKIISQVNYYIHYKDLPTDALQKFYKLRQDVLPVVNDNEEITGNISLYDLLLFSQNNPDPDISIFDLIEKGYLPLKSEKDFACINQCHHDEVLKQIINNIYCGIITIAETGKLIVCNSSAKRMLKLDKEDIIGNHIEKIKPLEGFVKLILKNNGHGRHKLIVNDVAFIITLIPLIRDKIRIGVSAIFHESAITECISQELFVTEKLLKEINIFIESSYDGLLVTDSQGEVIRVNAAWERIFSISRNEIIGHKVKDLVKRGVYGKSAAQMVIETKKNATVMFENKGRNIMATGTPVPNNEGEITSVVVNVRDITELVNLKSQLETQQTLAEKYSMEIKEIRRRQQILPTVIGHSKVMEEVIDIVTRVAVVDSTVLITGESGVGKEMIANLIHQLSPRADGPIIKINCSSIPHALLESELFGYERGAFTGASAKGKIGFFELANGGTILLDEIGEINLELQAKLLRVVQEKEIIRLGGTKTTKIDVRILAATNRDLKKMIQEKTFREDLFYRLNVIRIKVPTLRERTEDIVPLSIFFLDKYNKKYRKNKTFSSEIINIINDYSWPGNIRELENLVETLVILAKNDEIKIDDLPEAYIQPSILDPRIVVKGIMPLKRAIEMVELQLIKNAKENLGSTRKIAKALGINQSTVVRKMAILQHQ